jgi:sulfate adenylyltransferase subunit 1 (EFTu-like GTPase family)
MYTQRLPFNDINEVNLYLSEQTDIHDYQVVSYPNGELILIIRFKNKPSTKWTY